MRRKIRVVERYAMPRGVQAAAYSPDGDQLVVGGGHGYGDGFITHIAKGRTNPWPLRGCPFDVGFCAISGLCFDATGRHLAVSAWAGHDYLPALLCRTGHDGLLVDQA